MTPQDSQSCGATVVRQGYATNAPGVAPAPNWQPFVPAAEIAGEIPRSSEFLKSLARHYILDPRTNVGAIHMEASGGGLVEMTITIKVADTV